MAETAAQKAARRAAIVARAKANPNASDKGTAGADAVDAVRKKVSTKQKQESAAVGDKVTQVGTQSVVAKFKQGSLRK